MVKEFWREAASQRERILTGASEKLIWHRPVGSNAVGCSSRADIVVDFCCIHVPQQWLAIKNGRSLTTPKNDPSPLGSRSPSNTWFLGPMHSSKRHLDRLSRFCRAHERDQQTQTARYSICSNRPHRCGIIISTVQCCRLHHSFVFRVARSQIVSINLNRNG